MFKTKRTILGGLIMATLATGALGLWCWATYPRHPDLSTATVDELVNFVGTNDFNRLSAAWRTKYCVAVTDRLRERSFPQLVAMVAARNGRLKQVADNVEHSGGQDEVEAAMLRVVLDKFYEESSDKRKIYLWGLVKMQQAGATGDDGIGLPSTQQFQDDMTRVVTHQPPRTVAQLGQFVQDLQQQRHDMGVPDPY